MTNSTIATRLGCHFTTVSRWRNGNRLPGVRLLERIATEFDIPREDLLAAHNEGPRAFGRLLRERVFSGVESQAAA